MENLHGTLGSLSGDILKHCKNWRDADAGAHEHHRVVAFLEIELARWSRHVNHVALVDASVQVV